VAETPAAPGAAGTAPAPGAPTDPYRAYNFRLIIQERTEGYFTECSGLGIKVHPIRYREGGAGPSVRAIPGPVTYSDVVLRFGLTDSTELWEWLMSLVQGRVVRKNVSIALLDSDGSREVVRWNLFDAWPSEWRGAPLDALQREVAIETLTLVFERLERA
jgi:phage tail-like protein